jgi:hypothetical protein
MLSSYYQKKAGGGREVELAGRSKTIHIYNKWDGAELAERNILYDSS